METIEKLANGNLCVRVDYIFSRHGGRKKIIQKDESKEISGKTHDMSVLNTIARAYRWRELLDTGKVKSKDDLAKLLHYDQSYISRILRLTYLSPHIVRLFINGQAPSGLSLTTLHKAFPDDWNEQHEFFKIG